MTRRFYTASAAVALAIGLAAAAPARADDAAPPPHPMFGPVMVSGHVEAGTNINFASPNNNYNFGQLFTDGSNTFRVNQVTLTAEKDLDSSATTLDWGFKLSGMYGTDARYTHSFGLWDLETHSPYQWDFVEANLQAHLPIIFGGGIDLKAGIYSTPIGYEVIDATGNFFYTHSYIFNFGIPLKHTGVLSTSHILGGLADIYVGIDSGVNGWVPTSYGDNNATGAALFGLGINNPIPNLTILALAHIGPENGYPKGPAAPPPGVRSVGPAPDRNHYARQIYDIVTTYKFNDSLTLANELDYIKDDLAPGLSPAHGGATAEGMAFYGIYAFNDQWSFGGRAEIFRDDQGFFVAGFGSAQDFLRAERNTAVPANTVYGFGKSTYLEFTVGANYKVPVALPMGLGITIRPEMRWDHAFDTNGNKMFNMGANGVNKDNDQFLFSLDGIIAF